LKVVKARTGNSQAGGKGEGAGEAGAKAGFKEKRTITDQLLEKGHLKGRHLL